jgi:hypothetical protein
MRTYLHMHTLFTLACMYVKILEECKHHICTYAYIRHTYIRMHSHNPHTHASFMHYSLVQGILRAWNKASILQPAYDGLEYEPYGCTCVCTYVRMHLMHASSGAVTCAPTPNTHTHTHTSSLTVDAPFVSKMPALSAKEPGVPAS